MKSFSFAAFVVSADELLSFDQIVNNLSVELRELFRIAFAKNFKPAMPYPEVPHSITSIARFTVHFCCDVSWSLSQKPGPDSIRPKNCFKLGSFTFSDPEP